MVYIRMTWLGALFFAAGSTAATVIFLLLKTLADTMMHYVEHSSLRTPKETPLNSI